jgi:hypothetical protein
MEAHGTKEGDLNSFIGIYARNFSALGAGQHFRELRSSAPVAQGRTTSGRSLSYAPTVPFLLLAILAVLAAPLVAVAVYLLLGRWL